MSPTNLVPFIYERSLVKVVAGEGVLRDSSSQPQLNSTLRMARGWKWDEMMITGESWRQKGREKRKE